VDTAFHSSQEKINNTWQNGCGITSAPAASPAGRADSLGCVQLTVFWERMTAQFGAAYAQSVAKDYVFAGLGGRTVEQALADGEDAKVVWRAVCETFDVPERLRLFPGDLGVSVAVEYTFPLR